MSFSRSPLEQLEAEKEERELKLKKMQQDMEQVFELKVKEKKKKLRRIQKQRLAKLHSILCDDKLSTLTSHFKLKNCLTNESVKVELPPGKISSVSLLSEREVVVT